jgi:hypothetical protein
MTSEMVLHAMTLNEDEEAFVQAREQAAATGESLIWLDDA